MVVMSEGAFDREVASDAMGSFQVDERSVVPIWIQIRKRIVYLITSGKYRTDERLPSVRDLSVRLGVNYNTINKVYQDLERDGFIFTRRGKGTFVADVSAIEYSPDDGEMEAVAADFVQNALGKGMAPEDIVSLVKQEIEKLEGSKGM